MHAFPHAMSQSHRSVRRTGRLMRSLVAGLAALLLTWPLLARAVLPIEHWTTPGGARVLFVRAPAIPMVDISVSFDAGARYDPPGKAGVAAMTTGLLAKGIPGADEAAIAERFAGVGAERGHATGDDRASVSLRSLTSEVELETALATFERMLAAPTFPADVIAREKARMVQGLREAQTRPAAIARRAYAQMLYPNHPYGIQATPESVASIAPEDLAAFHRSRFSSNGAVVAMIGALSREQAERIALRLTAGLPSGAPAPTVPQVVVPERGAERRIAHPALQSHILIGMPALAWNDPDRFALTVGNYILGGGGFVSRLYDRVREKRGLAYSVYSYFSPSLQPGPFTIGLQTERSQTELALSVVRETLDAFLSVGPTDEEVAAAKANLIGGFPLRIDTNAKILGYLSAIGAYGLPIDYLERWPERIAAVDARQIREAFARHVRTAALSTVVVGAADAAPVAAAERGPSGPSGSGR